MAGFEVTPEAQNTPQLYDIAQPRISREHDLGPRSDAPDRFAVLFRELLDEETLEKYQIFSAIRQPRQFNLHHGQAIIKVLAELLIRRSFPEDFDSSQRPRVRPIS
jgi:hypothetical protein